MVIPSSPPSRRKRILICDDEAASRNTLARILGEHYDVVVAGGGKWGVALAAESRLDLILTDVMMPELDGFEMVRQIRARQGHKVPVIFLTALDGPRDVIAGIAAGARHYMSKPADLAELQQRIARALGLPSQVPPRR